MANLFWLFDNCAPKAITTRSWFVPRTVLSCPFYGVPPTRHQGVSRHALTLNRLSGEVV